MQWIPVVTLLLRIHNSIRIAEDQTVTVKIVMSFEWVDNKKVSTITRESNLKRYKYYIREINLTDMIEESSDKLYFLKPSNTSNATFFSPEFVIKPWGPVITEKF